MRWGIEDEDEVGGGMSTRFVSAPGFTDGVRLSQVFDHLPGAALGQRGGGTGAMGDDEEDQEDTNLDRPRAQKRGEGGATTRSEEEEDEENEEDGFKSDLLEKALGLEESPIGVFGWLQGSFTGNPASPRNNENFGVIPNSIANRFLFQQLYFVVEKLPEREDVFDWGFRVDNLFGTDWQQFHVVGFFDNAFRPNHFGYSLMQAYAEVHLPVLTPGGVDVKGGQFYSLAGYEDVAAPGRPLNSTSYMFAFSHPFTNLGLMTIWHATDRFNVYNGVVNGSTRWFDTNYRWGYSGALSWESKDDATSLTFTCNLGPNQFPRYFPANFSQAQVPNGVVSPPFLARRRNLSYNANNLAIFTTVLTHEWTEDFTTVIEADQGFETNIPGLGKGGTVGNGSWFGVGRLVPLRVHRQAHRRLPRRLVPRRAREPERLQRQLLRDDPRRDLQARHLVLAPPRDPVRLGHGRAAVRRREEEVPAHARVRRDLPVLIGADSIVRC